MQFYIQTFGCQMNENDSRLLASLLQKNGYQEVARPEDAGLILINTCCVRENAENKALGYLGSIKKLYEEDRSRVIVICGCMMQQKGKAELIRSKYPYVKIIMGTFSASRLPEYIAQVSAGTRSIIDVEEHYDGTELKYTPETVEKALDGDYKAQVNISYGCNNFCSYCIVPYVRGRERSRSAADILEEIRLLTENGVREVQLLGQNVNSYGKDLPAAQSCDFASLLEQVCQVPGLRRVRYMTSHPRDFSYDLVDVIRKNPKICHHFHLPLQAGCDELLKRMNRGYSRKYYWELLQYIRSRIPEAVISTDLIVGFPGETEQQFQETLDFVAECRFDAAYTFIYSQRSGTPAAKMPDQIPEEEKKLRLQRLMDVQNAISLELNQAMLGKNYEVMVEGLSKNNADMLSGRTEGNKIVVFPVEAGNQIRPGDCLQLQITAAHTWNLEGELLP
ncbi:MAG: tRNA (N6-isopentenyl adenosine(37)-C2)-methylthiotransferase MiaB [Bacillota bacterium]|nr:tRNA (N6-isopentenyl adenosine(37)-C2)-methylthiotransferase MiaB [Bacillota bacterium]